MRLYIITYFALKAFKMCNFESVKIDKIQTIRTRKEFNFGRGMQGGKLWRKPVTRWFD